MGAPEWQIAAAPAQEELPQMAVRLVAEVGSPIEVDNVLRPACLISSPPLDPRTLSDAYA
jgi:hypothetical protein